MSSSIKKWELYCNTEAKYVYGFLDNDLGKPSKCFNNDQHTIDSNKTKLLECIHRHTTELIKWKVFCDTEQIDTYGYRDHLDPPIHCFNNDTHLVSKLPVIMEKIYNNTMRIEEEIIETGGNIQFKSFQFDIPSGATGSVTDFESSFPHPISMISTHLLISNDNVGDCLEADIGHHTTIGTITEDVSSGITGGTTGFGVSQTVIDNLNLGYYVTLTDGTNTDELGKCIMIDKINKKISTEIATTNSFSASTPTYLQQSVKMIDTLHIVNNQNIILGADKIGSSHVPANTIGRFRYTNNDGLAKKFTFLIQYLY